MAVVLPVPRKPVIRLVGIFFPVYHTPKTLAGFGFCHRADGEQHHHDPDSPGSDGSGRLSLLRPNCALHDLANISIFSEATGILSEACPQSGVVRRKRSLRRFLSLCLAATSVAGSWRVNFWQIIQRFEKPQREHAGDSVARRLFDALTGRFRIRRSRRVSGASASLRLESLEVRQVLSSSNPVAIEVGDWIAVEPSSDSDPELTDPEVKELSEVARADVARMVQSFRGQLSAAIDALNPPQMADTAEVADAPMLSSDANLTAVPQLAANTARSEVASSQSAVNVRVVLDWSHSEQQVTIVGLSVDDIAVTVHGLGSISAVKSDVAFAEELIVSNTAEIFGILLPHRTVEISFQKPAPAKDSSVRFDQATANPPAQVAKTDREFEPETPARLTNDITLSPGRSIRSALPDEPVAPENLVDFAELIDEVFLDGSLIAAEVSLASIANFSLSSEKKTERAADLSEPVPDVRLLGALANAAVEMDGRLQSLSEVTHGLNVPGVVPGLVRRGWSLLKSGKRIIGDVNVRRSLADLQRSHSDIASREDQSTKTTEDLNRVLDWFSWIINPADERRNSGTEGRIEVRAESWPSPVPARQDAVSRDVQKSSVHEHSQARRLRENLRQHIAWGGMNAVLHDELEMEPLPVSGSFPAELRFECQPRAPPVFGRTLDTSSAGMDAPESLLERLRYSIAPRGPSLVTVEMQSPDFEFSSGPRVSPEELRYLAA